MLVGLAVVSQFVVLVLPVVGHGAVAYLVRLVVDGRRARLGRERAAGGGWNSGQRGMGFNDLSQLELLTLGVQRPIADRCRGRGRGRGRS